MKRQGDWARYAASSPLLLFSSSPLLLIILCLLTLSACREFDKPKSEPYYAETAPPPRQEFRWSNGKTPKSFDPALAAAPPETDVVRAIYEGLTDTNAKNLEPIPAVALKWQSEQEDKVWTFHLRPDAKWSNGEIVTAEDFVRSWKRLSEMDKDISHPDLLNNIVGMQLKKKDEFAVGNLIDKNELEILPRPPITSNLPVFDKHRRAILPKQLQSVESEKPEVVQSPNFIPLAEQNPKIEDENKKEPEKEKFGVEALDKFTLKVILIKPDKDFPALVAHPMFYPIHAGTTFEKNKLNADIITNGAFRLASVGQDGVTLDKAESYWNRNGVELQKVRFVPQESAEKALEAYRAGEVDAITNAEFAPLALKLLTPYDDFQRTIHSALNFYEFNQNRKPFDDKRVREALAISIERERLTDDEMDGATKPALGFLPYAEENEAKISQDTVAAQKLLSDAGFPNGENFPAIKLLINRNDVQQRIARSVAKMWKQNLNIETEIIVREPEEIEAARRSGEYDIVRRNIVLPTSDETANMLAIFSPEKPLEERETDKSKDSEVVKEDENAANPNGEAMTALINPGAKSSQNSPRASNILEAEENLLKSRVILTEEDAINQLPAIPLYFPTSYLLVKPYVRGFEINTLDAPSLKKVSINNDWQTGKREGDS